jgi:hypothetical protein
MAFATTLACLLLIPLVSVATPILEVGVEADEVRLNGQLVAAPARKALKSGAREEISLKKVRAALGRENRSAWGHNNLRYIWDRMGFTAGEMHDGGSYLDGRGPAQGAIYNLSLQWQADESPRDTDPKQSFRGDLVIDGLKITAQSKVVDLQYALEKLGFEFDWRRTFAKREAACSSVTLGWERTQRNPTFKIFIFDAH